MRCSKPIVGYTLRQKTVLCGYTRKPADSKQIARMSHSLTFAVSNCQHQSSAPYIISSHQVTATHIRNYRSRPRHHSWLHYRQTLVYANAATIMQANIRRNKNLSFPVEYFYNKSTYLRHQTIHPDTKITVKRVIRSLQTRINLVNICKHSYKYKSLSQTRR